MKRGDEWMIYDSSIFHLSEHFIEVVFPFENIGFALTCEERDEKH